MGRAFASRALQGVSELFARGLEASRCSGAAAGFLGFSQLVRLRRGRAAVVLGRADTASALLPSAHRTHRDASLSLRPLRGSLPGRHAASVPARSRAAPALTSMISVRADLIEGPIGTRNENTIPGLPCVSAVVVRARLEPQTTMGGLSNQVGALSG